MATDPHGRSGLLRNDGAKVGGFIGSVGTGLIGRGVWPHAPMTVVIGTVLIAMLIGAALGRVASS